MRALLIVLAGAGLALAQSTGEVTGTLTDPSGAAITAATIELRDPVRNTVTKSEPNATGNYRFTGIAPGEYFLTVSASGFSEARVNGILVEVNRVSRADIAMSLAGTAATVDVNAQAQSLDADNGTKGTVLNLERARDLPLQSRNPLALAALTPGVVSPVAATGSESTTRQGSDGTAASSGLTINGGVRTSGGFTEVLVDGISITSQRDGVLQALPAADTLQEFRVQSGGMGPEVGRTVGGVINYATRSGTNELHGNLFWSNRNTATTARRALPAVGDKPRNNFNQYGVTAGGPVYLPGVYNGRNKTFFFAGFEGSRWLRNNPTLDTVPTLRMRNGDFSELTTRIYDPQSSPAAAQRTQFPGNIIPSSRIDPIGKSMLDAFPLPDRPGISANFDGMFRVVTPVDNYTVRLDHQMGTRHRLMGRVTWVDSVNNQGWNLGPNDGRTGVSDIPSRNVTLNYNFTLTPSLLYTASAGYTWFHRTFIDPTGNQSGAGFFGMEVTPQPSTLATNIRPIVSWDLYRNLAANTVEDQLSETYQWNQSLAWIRGSHTFRTGTDLRWFIAGGALTVGAPNGSFGFAAAQTSMGNATTGYGAASALLGLPNSVSFAQPPVLNVRKAAPSFYVQDDYRVSRTLTLNLGLRFDYEGGLTEEKDRIGYLSNAINPIVKVPGVFRYAGANGDDRSILQPVFAVSPRLGFAWSPSFARGFVIRGSVGAYNAPVPTVGPYSAAVGYEPTLQFVRPTANDPATRLVKSWTLPAAAGPLGDSAYLGQSVSQVADRRLDPPRIYQWNFGVQKELVRDLVVEALYTGNRGTRLLANYNIDLPDKSAVDTAILAASAGNPGAAQTYLNELVPNPLAGLVSGTLGATTVARSQAISRYPQFAGVTPVLNIRDSSYHALQTTAQRRFSQGLMLLVSYTWSKLISDFVSLQNPYDLRDSRGLVDVDRPHAFSTAFAYSLPFGRSITKTGWIAKLTGGFQLNGIFRATGGAPVSVTQSAQNGLGVGTPRPDVIGDAAAASRNVRRTVAANGNVVWLDRSSYAPVTGRFGTAPAADSRLRAPGFAQFDAGLTRTFPIVERVSLRFNAQAFNLLNHTNLVGLDTNVSSPTFGQLPAAGDPRIFQFGVEVRF